MAPFRDLPHATSSETGHKPSLSLRATEGNVAISLFPMHYEIASVVSLPRNDITKQPLYWWSLIYFHPFPFLTNSTLHYYMHFVISV
jgi:hypothetical protein